MRSLQHFVLFLILMTCSIVASGCNTMEGLGQDIEQAGDSIEDAAEDAAN